MKDKLLIFGIDSFTGFHLKNFLKNHFDIYGTSIDNKYIKCDITKKDEILKVLTKIKPDYIINLSAISFVGSLDKEAFYKVNTIGSLNILDAILELNLKLKKIILVSSATVYGNQNVEILDESLCPKPTNHYGVSKYAMETLARNYFDKLPIIITRPFNYTGVGQAEHFLIPKIVKHFKEKKESIELGNLDVVREFNDIYFVCEVYEKLLISEVVAETINIASGRGIKLLEVINLMNEIANYEIKVKINPDFIRKNEIKKLIGSNKKLFSLIGKIKQKNFKITLKDMYEQK